MRSTWRWCACVPLGPRDAAPSTLAASAAALVGEARIALDAEEHERREDQQHHQPEHQPRVRTDEIEHGSGLGASRDACRVDLPKTTKANRGSPLGPGRGAAWPGF
jgi:hypothetical protein